MEGRLQTVVNTNPQTVKCSALGQCSWTQSVYRDCQDCVSSGGDLGLILSLKEFLLDNEEQSDDENAQPHFCPLSTWMPPKRDLKQPLEVKEPKSCTNCSKDRHSQTRTTYGRGY